MKYVFPEYKENVVLGNGKLQLNPMSYQVIYEGKEIDLTPREFEVLYLLALKPNWVMPKTTIYHSVWGIHYHDDQIPYRTVEYVIWKIRKKMGYDLIETLVNVGYTTLTIVILFFLNFLFILFINFCDKLFFVNIRTTYQSLYL